MLKRAFVLFITLMFVTVFLGSTVTNVYASNQGTVPLEFQTHISNIGWGSVLTGGSTSGNPGSGQQLEAIAISLKGPQNFQINYRAHVQDIGWMAPVSNGNIAGTVGQAKRLEAIGIWLTGPHVFGYNVRYQVYVAGLGWFPEVCDGMNAGTTGQNRRIEAIKISITYRDKYIYVGNFAVSDYNNATCSLGSISRVADLAHEIDSSFTERNTQSFNLNNVTRSNFFSIAPQKDLVFYSGHGYSDHIHIASTHPYFDELYPDTLISKGDFVNLGLGINNQVDYLHLNTCNMLSVNDVNLQKMLGSMKMMLGYATKMQMYPGQMQKYISFLEQGETMWEAWKDASIFGQATNNAKVNAARIFDQSYYYATLNNIDESKPAPYPNNAIQYEIASVN